MISLRIEDYCGNCSSFNPIKNTTAIIVIDSTDVKYETTVYCEHEDKCKKILAHIKSEVSKKNEV